jgi:hypothetical protein
LYNKATHRVHGAFLLTECSVLDAHRDAIYWNCDRAVALAEQIEVRPSQVSWSSTLIHLQPLVEETIRRAGSAVGGCLNDHMVEVAGERWYMWPADTQLEDRWRQYDGSPFVFTTDAKFAKAVGVTPDVVAFHNMIVDRCPAFT